MTTSLLRFALAVLAISVGSVQRTSAGHIDVSYTVSGSPGAYLLNFSVNNNMLTWPTQTVYFFGVRLSVDNVVSSPTPFFDNAPMDYNPFNDGGSNTDYNNIWVTPTPPFAPPALLPGNTLSGFIVQIPDSVAPTEVNWVVLSVSPGRVDPYTGGENFNPPGIQGQENPGFEGVATSGAMVPEPSTLVMMTSGLMLSVGHVVRRRLADAKGSAFVSRPIVELADA